MLPSLRYADPDALEHVIEVLQSRAGNGVIEAPPAAAGAKKNWAKDFDADNVSQLVVSIAQAAGIYACIMARRCLAR